MNHRLLNKLFVLSLSAICLTACGTAAEAEQAPSASSADTASEEAAPAVPEANTEADFTESPEPVPEEIPEETEPSAAKEEATPEPTPDPAEAERAAREADEAAMYAAYLDKLQEYQSAILGYDWQMSDGEFHYPAGSEPFALRPVALADICGDENPELLFINLSDNGYYGNADLHIYGWRDGKLLDLFSYPQWDVAAASGTHYCLFQQKGEKTLYAYTYIGDETGFYTWYRFEGEEALSAEETASAEVNWAGYEDRPDIYTVAGRSTDQAAYEAYCAECAYNAEKTVLFSASESGDTTMAALFQKEMISMNLNDAVAYLTPLASAAASAAPTDGSTAEAFTLDALQGLSLVFTSGAGAWDTNFTMEADGAFSGSYHDSNMGESGDGYDASLYLCPFTGRFSNLQKVSDTVYTADLAELNYTYTPGDEWIENEGGAHVRYIASEAYGLYDCSQVTIYLPGTPIADIPENALFTLFYEGTTLDGVVIYGSGDFYTSEVPSGLPAAGTADSTASASSAASGEGQIFPDSDARNLTDSDLAGLSSVQIQQAINEIFARRGYSFHDPDILAFFNGFSWYHPTTTDMDAVSAKFNRYETANVNFLAAKL